jgi:uncharacterized protein
VSNYPLDLALILVFVLVQWRITYLVLRATAHRWVRPAVFAFAALLATGYAFTFSIALVRLGVPSHIGSVMGAFSLSWCILTTLVLAIYETMTASRRVFHAEHNPARRRLLNAAGGALMAAPLGAAGYGAIVTRTDFQVSEVDIPIPGLSADLDGFRILHLSDIHLSAFLTEAEFARVIDQSNSLNPHLAAVTGDLISGHSDPLDACIRQIARLKAPAGVFGCMGNHEHYARAESYVAKTAARQGVRFLRSEATALPVGNATLNLAGLDFQPQRARANYLKGAERLLVPGATNVLLQHNPDVFPVAARMGFDLLLAGHTHGGQVTVEIFERDLNLARFLTPYVHGLYREGNRAAYVTRGVGTIGIPARIGAPPEISLLRLRKV